MTENNIPTCERCGTQMYSFADDGEGFLTDRCPLNPKDCELKALRSEVEALRKRNEELEAYKDRLRGECVGALTDAGVCMLADTDPCAAGEVARAVREVVRRSESRAQELEKRNERLNDGWRLECRRNRSLLESISAFESRAQEAETKLHAAEDAESKAADAVLVLREALGHQQFCSVCAESWDDCIHGREAFELLGNTSALAAQRKAEIQREALERFKYKMTPGAYRRCAAILNPTEPEND